MNLLAFFSEFKRIVSHFSSLCSFYGAIFGILFFAVAFPLSAYQNSLVLGGENGWDKIEVLDGVTTGEGRFGFESLELVTQTPPLDDFTDLMITFDENGIKDAAGNYRILSSSLEFSDDSIKGKGSALSRGRETGAVLKGNEYSLFGREGILGSFTIEFWLSPAIVENGEEIFSWNASTEQPIDGYTGYPKYQALRATFNGNKIQWTFLNFFNLYDKSELSLSGITNIIPGKWSRHTLSFDETTGRLEYLVDGRTEAIKYITTTNHEGGEVCSPVVGLYSQLEICPKYIGKIDNFRIQRTAAEKDSGEYFMSGNETYRVTGGRFESKPLVMKTFSTLDEILPVMDVPAETEIRLYVRAGESFYNWTKNFPEWKEILPGEKIDGVSGRCFQVAAELLPDGAGENSPSITQLELKYTEEEPPLPPFTVHANPGDGTVTLTWSHSVDSNTSGYYVYYGNRPGEYTGRIATEGYSPVNAGNSTSITLTGLQNGSIYYFAISSYSKTDSRISGELSHEVFARPSARLSSR